MKILKNAYGVYRKTSYKISIFFYMLTIVSFVFASLINESSLKNTSIIFGIIAISWTVIWVRYFILHKNESRRIERLKNEGIKYDGKVEQIQPNLHIVRVGSNRSACAKCSYLDSACKKQFIKSGLFILDYPTSYIAHIYVDRSDPKDYYVEICIDENEGSLFELDLHDEYIFPIKGFFGLY